jgi:large subunit ribosomal protein L21
MKAIIHTQGRQFTVETGTVLIVNTYPAITEGSTFEIPEVLWIGNDQETRIGTPYVTGAKVTAKLLEHKRGKKVVIIKKKRRKGYERKRGHRQELSVIKIEGIHA